MKIFRISGKGMGYHSFTAKIITTTEEKAKEIFWNKVKEDKDYEIENIEIEEITSDEIKEGIVLWESGECC